MDYPIELKNTFFTRMIVVAVPDHVLDSTKPLEIAPINSLDVREVEGVPNEFTVTMKTVFNLENESIAPYILDVECIALFKVDPEVDKEEIQKRLTITGHSVLYGAIREAVIWVTARQPYGPMNLGLSILKPASPVDVGTKE